MNKMRISLVVTIFCLVVGIFGLDDVSSGAEVNPNQSTTGPQSPAVNAGRDSTIIYASEVEAKIIDKLSEIARKCKDPGVKLEDVKPELDSLALYKARALPYITSFAANYTDLQINKYDPNCLLNYRTKLLETSLFDALFYVIQKIYFSDPDARNYFYDLYTKKYLSGSNEREALMMAYYLWKLPPQETKDILAKLLKEVPISEWDPVRKVLLRTFLHTNVTDKYLLRPSQNSKAQARRVDETDAFTELKPLLFSAAGLESTQDGDTFLMHLDGFLYETLLEKSTGEHTEITVLLYPRIRNILGVARGLYLFGFDFFDMSLYNLKLDNILLGKTGFEKALLQDFEFHESSILECDFKKTKIMRGLFEGTKFIGCDFEGLIIRNSVFRGSGFRRSNMNDAKFVDVNFIDTNFEDCIFSSSESDFIGSLLLNVRFAACDLKRIAFNEVLIDEQTLKGISTLPGFRWSDYNLEEIDMKKLQLDSVTMTREDSKDMSPEMQLSVHLLILNRISKYHYDIAKAIIEKEKMFRMSSSEKRGKDVIDMGEEVLIGKASAL